MGRFLWPPPLRGIGDDARSFVFHREYFSSKQKIVADLPVA
jgi:hypothetical protein